MKIKEILLSALPELTLQLEASNVSLAQKEPIAQATDCQYMFFALMVHIQTWKDNVIVHCVTLATDVLVLEWKLLKHVQMEHTVTQLVLVIVFCVLKVTGEAFILFFSISRQTCVAPYNYVQFF